MRSLPLFFIVKILPTLAITGLATLSPALAAPLNQTQLFSKTVEDCKDVDLTNWRHPTRDILEKADVKLLRLQLCNRGKYPIYTVNFKYDPRTDTDSYFQPLYADMAVGNGYWPFSFVDIEDGVIIDVDSDGKKNITVNYEGFDN